MNCKICKNSHTDEQTQALVCRRFPPNAQMFGSAWSATFPPVRPEWACGEFKASEQYFLGGKLVYEIEQPPPGPRESVDPVVERLARMMSAASDENRDESYWRDYVPEIEAAMKPDVVDKPDAA